MDKLTKILTINASDNLIGGASRVAMDLHYEFKNYNFNSKVLVGKKFGFDKDITQINRSLVRKAFSYFLANDIDYFSKKSILDYLSTYSPNLIQCHNLHGWYFNLSTLILFNKLDIPVFWTLHDMWSILPISAYSDSDEIKNGLYKESGKKLYPSILWNNNFYLSLRKKYIFSQIKINLIVPSVWLKNKIGNTILSKNEVCVIPNGVDIDIFKPRKNFNIIHKYLFKESNSKIIMFMCGTDARNNPLKGFNYFFQLTKLLDLNHKEKNLKYICLGSTENEFKDGIIFIKSTDNKDEIAELFSFVDIFIMTSKYENYPLSILESLSCGVPVVSFDVGGIKEIINDIDYCYTVKEGSLDGLYNAVKSILELPNYYKENIILYLRSIAEKKFSLSAMTKNYISFYDSIINRL